MLVITATPGSATANSFETLLEAQAYFESRLPLAGWDNADSQDVLLVMATRVLNMMAQPHKKLRRIGDTDFYITGRQWTGSPTTTTQRLAWPRTGMYDANGNAIPSDVIPQALKDAQSELAGQLGETDTTLDNAVSVGGITSIKAGSVSLTFKDMIDTHVLPDAVMNLMPPSWFTDELISYPANAEFEVI